MHVDVILPARPDETYGRVNPEQWRDGLRYVVVLLNKFERRFRLPSWADRGELYGAGLEGLMAAARGYDPEKARWSTYMHRAIWQWLEREWLAQQNWQQNRAKTARFWKGRDSDEETRVAPLLSLDFVLLENGERMADLLPAPGDLEREVVDDLERRADRERLHRVLAELEPQDQEILRARLAGQSLRQAGQQIGRSFQTAQNREWSALRRARRVAEQLAEGER